MNRYTLRDIAEIGIFTGLAVILNLAIFKIKINGGAGSISFVMIPLFLIAIRHSWWKSFIAGGIVYGLIACLTSGYNFATYPFDYLLGFGSIAVISLFRKLILKEGYCSYFFLIISGILSTLIRIIMSTISGMIFFQYTFVASLIYNSIYISITGSIALGAMIILLKPIKLINNKYENK